MEVDIEQESSREAKRGRPCASSDRLLERGTVIQNCRHNGDTGQGLATTIILSVNERSERDITKRQEEISRS